MLILGRHAMSIPNFVALAKSHSVNKSCTVTFDDLVKAFRLAPQASTVSETTNYIWWYGQLCAARLTEQRDLASLTVCIYLFCIEKLFLACCLLIKC